MSHSIALLCTPYLASPTTSLVRIRQLAPGNVSWTQRMVPRLWYEFGAEIDTAIYNPPMSLSQEIAPQLVSFSAAHPSTKVAG
jgi:hypothetical protein